jgi:hypothetical protein
VQPQTILSYYPNYSILDSVVSTGNYKRVNIFADLKNNLQTLYMEHAVVNLVESSIKSNRLDSSIFSSVLSFLSFHKLYSIKRKIDIHVYIFFETGRSYYHLNLYPKYKVSRRIDDLYGLDTEKRNLFYKIVQNNLRMIETACNQIPKVKVFRLQNLEADFIPYYLLKNKLIETGPEIANIVYSNDHDLFQCLECDNTFIYSKASSKHKNLLKKGDAIRTYLKNDSNFPDSYLPLIMSIIGDSGDNIDGINGIGSKRVVEIIEQVMNLTGGTEQLYENVVSQKNIFDLSGYGNKNKYIDIVMEKESAEHLVSRNLKLVSFEILSRILNNPPTTELLERKKYISGICNQENKVSLESMRMVLDLNGVFLEEDALDIIYYGEK